MSILLTDTSLGVMLAPDEGAPLTAVPCGAESPCLPCGGQRVGVYVVKKGAQAGVGGFR